MIAAIDDGKELHVVRWTGRVRLHAGVICYCGLEADGSNGVLQVPETVFTQGLAYSTQTGEKRKPCGRCRVAAQAAVT